MTQPLAGKVALVTGGSRGIGAAIVRRLARDGADVVFSYASSHAGADAEAASRRATAIRQDVAAAVAFPIGPEDGYVTGAPLAIDGGLAA